MHGSRKSDQNVVRTWDHQEAVNLARKGVCRKSRHTPKALTTELLSWLPEGNLHSCCPV